MILKKLPLLWGLTFLIVQPYLTNAQTTDKWDLKRCVDYAVSNNISVKQADVQARISQLTYKQSKLAQIPTLAFSGNEGFNSGRHQDPTNFTLITTNYFSGNYQLQTGVNIFNFFNQKNIIAGNEFSYLAANANTEKLRNDISLNVANAYLQFLLTTETAKAAALQLSQSQAQLINTQKQVSAGTLPELNAAELESQVAQDSSALVTAKANVDQAALTVKAYMSLDAAAPFVLDTPPVEKIPVEPISELQPQNVYTLALQNQPLQKYDQLQIKASQKFSDASRSAMYPTISMYGGVGSGYISTAPEITGVTILPPSTTPVGTVQVQGSSYDVFSVIQGENPIYKNQGYFSQINQNFAEQVGVSINVPIFNGGVLKTNYQKSKLNVRNNELQLESDNLTLKQNIYQAYNAAITAFQKFQANKITVDATKRSYDYAQKRYNVGLLNTIDLLTNQNNYFKATIDLLSSQFDYVFKMKVLEFYKGLGLKL
jgi:outer membrane protein